MFEGNEITKRKGVCMATLGAFMAMSIKNAFFKEGKVYFLWLGYSFSTAGEEVEGVWGAYSGALLS